MNIQCPKCETTYTEKTMNITPQVGVEARFICKVCGSKNALSFEEKINWRGKVSVVPKVVMLNWDLIKSAGETLSG